ncbi:AMP-binding protein [Arenibaculum sp.]|jgi:acyl-[acyl-carrier-protein]-phospholipid O-acyltransferase/long-chain-fatty-acid--[acyl-carrier-protein] ligase|uniref:AMP-binding protein n=1 Tax=Arenibaculum sp. TaxID=2865862 RepID=UPI002E107917|nr:AMP-binding protein [Arenibaculum sp.]
MWPPVSPRAPATRSLRFAGRFAGPFAGPFGRPITGRLANALLAAAAAGAAAVAVALGAGAVPAALAGAAGLAGATAALARAAPRALVEGPLATIFRLAWRVKVRGVGHLHAAGPRAVIAPNHVSFLDGALLAAFLPVEAVYAVDADVARRPWLRRLLGLVDAVPIEFAGGMAMRILVRRVQGGRPCVIFPEGRISTTGSLMKVYDGAGMIAGRAGAVVVPVRIEGMQYTPFSRLRGKIRLRWFPRVTITVLPACRIEVPADLRGRARRRRIGALLDDAMAAAMLDAQDRGRTVFEALLDARDVRGDGEPVLEDASRARLGYGRLVAASLALARPLAAISAPGEAVGLLLPNANATAVAFFALQACGRVPAMLNPGAGAASLPAACHMAGVATVLTSRRFVERARLEPAVEALAGRVRIVHLEDLRDRLGTAGRLRGLLARPFARRIHRAARRGPQDPAVILFTSGSEGSPKGVALSHANLLANCGQLAARLPFRPDDVVFNALPMFHAFGLTGGLLLPLLNGFRTFLYPSPLHYRMVPELVYHAEATVMFGTDSFLRGYARVASPYDFNTVRLLFAGAEALKEETRAIWAERFGVQVLEGYGATEAAPVIAVNTPMQPRPGTVGRLLPGIGHRLEPVEGIADGGRLLIRGPNVMLGYLTPERPGVPVPPDGGWHDTGDVATLDAQGFVRIVGRLKRFAKVAGEMVPLATIEAEAARLWPDAASAAVALPDERRGERIVLVTEAREAGREALRAHLRAAGLPEIMAPRAVVRVERVPLLASGKVDYPAVVRLAGASLRSEPA